MRIMNVKLNTKINQNCTFGYSGMKTIRQEFPRLQTPCPIVDGFEKRKNTSDNKKNYITADPSKVDYYVKQGEKALPELSEILIHSNDNTKIAETLYILNIMSDKGIKNIDKMYPVFSRFNNTKSPEVQTFLAGIYRKTQVPDGFGPLVKMLVQNSMNPPVSNFDPNEEIGGAILAYLNPRFNGNKAV